MGTSTISSQEEEARWGELSETGWVALARSFYIWNCGCGKKSNLFCSIKVFRWKNNICIKSFQYSTTGSVSAGRGAPTKQLQLTPRLYYCCCVGVAEPESNIGVLSKKFNDFERKSPRIYLSRATVMIQRLTKQFLVPSKTLSSCTTGYARLFSFADALICKC